MWTLVQQHLTNQIWELFIYWFLTETFPPSLDLFFLLILSMPFLNSAFHHVVGAHHQIEEASVGDIKDKGGEPAYGTLLQPIRSVMTACTGFTGNAFKRNISSINQRYKNLPITEIFHDFLLLAVSSLIWCLGSCVPHRVITVTFFYISITITTTVHFVTKTTEVRIANVTGGIKDAVRAAVNFIEYSSCWNVAVFS